MKRWQSKLQVPPKDTRNWCMPWTIKAFCNKILLKTRQIKQVYASGAICQVINSEYEIVTVLFSVTIESLWSLRKAHKALLWGQEEPVIKAVTYKPQAPVQKRMVSASCSLYSISPSLSGVLKGLLECREQKCANSRREDKEMSDYQGNKAFLWQSAGHSSKPQWELGVWTLKLVFMIRTTKTSIL